MDKNLCILVNNLEMGGSERKVIRVANYLSAKGVSVCIAALKHGDDEFLRSELNPEVVFHRIAGVKKYKFLWKNTFHNYFFLNGFPALFIALVRFINRSSNLIYLNNTTALPDDFSKVRLLFLRVSASLSDLVVYGAKAQKTLWKSNYGFSNIKGIVLHNGVDHARFQYAGRGEGRHIVMVGQIRPEKNYSEAIEAVDRLRDLGVDYKLTIVGGGSGLNKLKELVHSKGLSDRVELLGELKDVRQVLTRGSIFLLCSNSVETFSNAALEAMAIGKVVILSNVGGATEMVRSEVDGFVYESGDIDRLVSILTKLVDVSLVDQYSLSARERIESKFTSTSMMNSYFGILK